MKGIEESKSTRSIAIVALIVSVAVGFFSIYLPYFWTDRDLHVTISGFRFDPFDEVMRANLVFANGGNQYEAIMAASFILPIEAVRPFGSGGQETFGPGEQSTFWPTRFPYVTLAPLVLKPGEVVYRLLEQPIDTEGLVAVKQISSAGVYVDPEYQEVAVEILIRDKGGLPRHHLIKVARTAVKSEARYWVRYGNVEIEGTQSEAIVKADLLTGGTVGIRTNVTDREYKSGIPGNE